MHAPCNLPFLESDLPLESVVEVSTSSFFSDECPIAISKKSQLQRDWGVLRLQWHGSPHRLWMHAETNSGADLYISGNGVKSTESSFLGDRYTAVKRFDGQSYIDADVATDFELVIRADNENAADRLELTYDTLKCVCAEYDSI